MVRFSVSLDEEQNEWVEQRAEELHGSKSQVVGMVIDAARRNDVPLSTHLGRNDGSKSQALEDKFEALEARVAELESAIQADDTTSKTDSQMSEPSNTESEGDGESSTEEHITASPSAASNGQLTEHRGDPEIDAVRTFIKREANERTSEEEVTECWEFLKQRGTASSKAFKDRFAPESCMTEEDVETWWQDGVKPVFKQLPGVEPPEDGGRFYRYKY